LTKAKAIVLLGTNIGDKRENLREASGMISERVGKVISKSSIYYSAPWGQEDQPGFLNQVISIKTYYPPIFMMKTLLNFELLMGRKRLEKWGPRLIDIDILFYNDIVMNTASLKLPHPGIPDRRFTLEPLVEMYPNLYHPVHECSVKALLERCEDPLPVKRLNIK
jgi:2-amino-4-hydroxy-6-hydroxymethyldihydropteridine diphosphokinase